MPSVFQHAATQRLGKIVGLLLLVLILGGCRAAVQDAAGQLSNALQTAATLDAGGAAPSRATPTPRAATRTAIARATPKARATATALAQQGVSDLPIVRYDSLPRQAKQTIELIDQGGPFPFDADGSVFQNRERLLPRRSGGYYREYTVITPGSDDRGARRIVAGAEGELYYTDDHYDSFREVIR